MTNIKDNLSALLVSGPLYEVRLDLTTRCNLRCVYCAVSQSTYRGEDMPMDNARHAVGMVAELARFHKPDAVHVNGHGETTFMSGWIELCNRLLAEDLFLWMTTNLAKRYSQEELDVLSRMSVIMVSIDTADARLLR